MSIDILSSEGSSSWVSRIASMQASLSLEAKLGIRVRIPIHAPLMIPMLSTNAKDVVKVYLTDW